MKGSGLEIYAPLPHLRRFPTGYVRAILDSNAETIEIRIYAASRAATHLSSRGGIA